MIYLGIDPGFTGAICALYDDEYIIDFWDMPMFGKNLDCVKIWQILTQHHGDKYRALIERSQAMPGQGVVSMFRYGFCYGVLFGMLTAAKIPFETIAPREWKKHFNLVKKPKEESILAAKTMYPSCAKELTLKKHHGRADALLLAELSRRIHALVGENKD